MASKFKAMVSTQLSTSDGIRGTLDGRGMADDVGRVGDDDELAAGRSEPEEGLALELVNSAEDTLFVGDCNLAGDSASMLCSG